MAVLKDAGVAPAAAIAGSPAAAANDAGKPVALKLELAAK
jgi:hypothetical protein